MNPHSLKLCFQTGETEAGCDEAGRGCLAGPVFAAAVVLPSRLDGDLPILLNDSKRLSAQLRAHVRILIERQAFSWAVAMVGHREIDRINILRASIRAMHLAIDKLHIRPGLLLIDGPRFEPHPHIPHRCIVGGDGIYMAVAAASILAKTHRDAYMEALHKKYPVYGWERNKGYPTPLHKKALRDHGLSPWHRRTFGLKKGPEA